MIQMRSHRKSGVISRHQGRTEQRAFTLIELIVVMAIVAILVKIAYPSYVQYVVKSKRKAAESFILTVANTEEKYALDARQYATGTNAVTTTLGLAIPPEVSPYYTVSVAANPAVTLGYIITATPIGTQLSGDATYGNCVNLTLDQSGLKGVSGTGSVATCW